MTVVPVILDHPLPGARSEEETLLRVPLGTATLLARLAGQIGRISGQPPRIVCAWGCSEAYRAALEQSGVRLGQIMETSGLAELVDRLEPSDEIMLVDARFFGADFDPSEVLARQASAGRVTHVLSVRGEGLGARELIEQDERGDVRRIRRFYDGVTYDRAAGVAWTRVGVAALQRIAPEALGDLPELRAQLAQAHVAARDVPLAQTFSDLSDPRELVALQERIVTRESRRPAPRGFTEIAPQVLAGEHVRVHGTARLVGPLVLHSGVTVNAGAALIGPLTAGAGATFGAESLAAQALLFPESSTAPGARICQQLVIGREVREDESAAPAPAIEPPEPDSKTVRDDSRMYAFAKRAVDVALAGLGVLLLSPLLAAVALLVRCTSRGPILYADWREGRGGRNFRCYKFRTMVTNAHDMQRELYVRNEVAGPQFKMKRDPRVTPIGAWLRQYNIDELPQLFNVLIGDMSLIGPRPSPFRENQICVAWRQARLSVRPGISGLWQICRQEGGASGFQQWIYFDTLYVSRRSFGLDLRILVATILSLGGRIPVPVRLVLPGGEAGLPRAAVKAGA